MIKKIYQKLQTKEGLILIGSLAIIITVIAALSGVFKPKYQALEGSQPIPSIRVAGNGEVTVSPDIAQFSFSISKDAKTTTEARNEVVTIGNELLEKLKTAGIKEEDIKTENISTYPKYENRAITDRSCTTTNMSPGASISIIPCAPTYNSVVVGYTVSINYSVKVRDLDKVSTIAMLLTDAKLFSVDGPNFTIDDVQAVSNQAREDAIEDAKKQAKILSLQLGVKLGKIIDFQVDGGYSPVPMYDRTMLSAGNMKTEASVAPELPTGETTVKSRVYITYRIK